MKKDPNKEKLETNYVIGLIIFFVFSCSLAGIYQGSLKMQLFSIGIVLLAFLIYLFLNVLKYGNFKRKDDSHEEENPNR